MENMDNFDNAIDNAVEAVKEAEKITRKAHRRQMVLGWSVIASAALIGFVVGAVAENKLNKNNTPETES